MVRTEAPAEGESRRKRSPPSPKATAPRFYSTQNPALQKNRLRYVVLLLEIRREKPIEARVSAMISEGNHYSTNLKCYRSWSKQREGNSESNLVSIVLDVNIYELL